MMQFQSLPSFLQRWVGRVQSIPIHRSDACGLYHEPPQAFPRRAPGCPANWPTLLLILDREYLREMLAAYLSNPFLLYSLRLSIWQFCSRNVDFEHSPDVKTAWGPPWLLIPSGKKTGRTEHKRILMYSYELLLAKNAYQLIWSFNSQLQKNKSFPKWKLQTDRGISAKPSNMFYLSIFVWKQINNSDRYILKYI